VTTALRTVSGRFLVRDAIQYLRSPTFVPLPQSDTRPPGCNPLRCTALLAARLPFDTMCAAAPRAPVQLATLCRVFWPFADHVRAGDVLLDAHLPYAEGSTPVRVRRLIPRCVCGGVYPGACAEGSTPVRVRKAYPRCVCGGLYPGAQAVAVECHSPRGWVGSVPRAAPTWSSTAPCQHVTACSIELCWQVPPDPDAGSARRCVLHGDDRLAAP
jgi:hypothetical protein